MKALLAFLIALISPSILPANVAAEERISLPVPFVWEIPDGAWVKPWNNACEEASVIMTEAFYLGTPKKNFSRTEAKEAMFPLFGIEDRLFGSNADTDAARTTQLINDYTAFDATIKENPTLEEIKAELQQNHPVISLHYGYGLQNPHHRFRRGGSSYHMMVIVGFDEDKKEFLVNDPELKTGLDYPYPYDTILNTLHDFNHKTRKADGRPVVLFTSPKQIVKSAGSQRVYLVRDDKKYYITNQAVFKNHRWPWKLVKTVDKSWLERLTSGEPI